MLIIYCCMTDYLKTQWFKTARSYHLTVSVVRNLGAAQLGDSGSGSVMNPVAICDLGM